MPGTFSYTLQVVNGDPFTSGSNINITTGTVEEAAFDEFDIVTLSNVATGDTITIAGLVYQYDYLGSHDVRGDPLQPAAYIRIVDPLPTGSTLTVGDTFALDLTGLPGDPDYPNLANGNTKGSVAELDTTTEVKFPGVVCFAAGTMLLTPKGEVAVENLLGGDLVETADTGPQPIIWIGSTRLNFGAENEDQKPILISAGVLGPDAPHRNLIVSPQHKVLLTDASGEEVLAPAKGLTSHRGIRVMQGRKKVEYFHVLLPEHAIIYAEGLATESFYPGQTALKMLTAFQRRKIKLALPALKGSTEFYGPKARASLTRRQAEELPMYAQSLMGKPDQLASLYA